MKKTVKIPLPKNELKEILDFAKKTAIEAGKILLHYQKKIDSLKVTQKIAQGAVSSADLASEKLILKRIEKKYPGHEILAEEMLYALQKNSSNYEKFQNQIFCWSVDPLDGTNNFLSGSDYFAVCISLLFYGNPIIGVVYRPPTGELFSSMKGGGAYLENIKNNSKPVRLNSGKKIKKLSESILVTGFVSEKGKAFDQEFKLFKKILLNTRAVRRMGSAALDLCYVSKGTFDGFWEQGLAPWDISASGLIALESGLIVTDYKKCPYCPYNRTIMAAPSSFYKKFQSLLSK